MARLGERKPINEAEVTELASKGYTLEYIAAMQDVSHDTLQRRCASALKRGWAIRNGCLQAKQVELSQAGNPTMCIWLGKQWLGQADKVEHKETGSPKGYGQLTPGANMGRPDKPDREATTVH
jgi:hypothetical protein